MNGSGDFWEDVWFELFKIFGWVALVGLLMMIVGLLVGNRGAGLAIFGVLLLIPLAIHGTLLSVWHWKSRYKGKHSKLWGALIFFETTGWFKLIYFFRHVLPDRRGRGRYAAVGLPQT